MKQFIMLMLLLAAVGFVVSCGNDVTEVAWKNSDGSDGSIREIKWTQNTAVDVEWDETVAKNAVSSAKEVNNTEGTVECLVDENGNGDFAAAQVKVNGESGAVRLNEGSSQVLTLQANN